MKRLRLILAILPFFLIAGCWDSLELTDRIFVMAVALDDGEDGKIKMTVQFYKPTASYNISQSQQGEQLYFNVTTENTSLPDAVRGLVSYVGRKPQWSHLRSLLIGEALARKGLKTSIDFFFRDSEPRLNTEVMVTKGEAGRYLDVVPYIENTIAQQLRETQRQSSRFSSMTVDADLLTLAMQTKSQTGIASVPYLALSEMNEKSTVVSGIGLFRQGKLASRVPPQMAEYTLMLMDKYRSGVVKAKCLRGEESESLFITRLKTKSSPIIRDNRVDIDIHTEIEAAVGSLKCTSLRNEADEFTFIRNFETEIRRQMEKALEQLQSEGIDALGIGDKIYRQSPSLWRRWKAGWPERFSQADARIRVHLTITNHGITMPKPILEGMSER